MPNIKIRGLDAVYDKFDDIEDFRAWASRPLFRSGSRIVRFMADYPPELPAQEYVRTGDLGRSWTVDRPKKIPKGIRVSVGTVLGYGPFVQSDQFQARIHRNRWQTDRDAVRQLGDDIQRDMDRAIRKVINK